jgi:hypothetical protein
VNDATRRISDLDLKLPALNAQHIVKALCDRSRVGVGEGHPSSPWAMLQVLLIKWRC